MGEGGREGKGGFVFWGSSSFKGRKGVSPAESLLRGGLLNHPQVRLFLEKV